MKYFFNFENGKIISISTGECVDENIICVEVTEQMYNNAETYGNNYYIYSNNKVVLNPNYEQEQADKRQTDFEKEFFNTSLGWIRRTVTMADGGTKDFLSDLLPAISMALNMGQAVNIITYKTPDFTHDITDWTIYQEVKQATPQFIQECFNQLNNDFIGG